MTEHPFHKAANLFPLMDENDLAALADDIAKNTQREGIWRHNGLIIDGRNRYLACLSKGIEPWYREWPESEGSIVAFVVSLNLMRRHLTVNQRTMIGVDILPMIEEETREKKARAVAESDKKSPRRLPKSSMRANLPSLKDESEEQEEKPKRKQKESARATAQAAEIVKVSRRNVQNGKKIREKGVPELKEAVVEDKIKVSAAAEIAALPPEKQVEVVKEVETGTPVHRAINKAKAKDTTTEDAKKQAVKGLRMLEIGLEALGVYERFKEALEEIRSTVTA